MKTQISHLTKVVTVYMKKARVLSYPLIIQQRRVSLSLTKVKAMQVLFIVDQKLELSSQVMV